MTCSVGTNAGIELRRLKALRMNRNRTQWEELQLQWACLWACPPLLPGPGGALPLVLQQHNEAADALFSQHGLFEQRLADVNGERVDQSRLHHHLHRQLAHDHVGGSFVVAQRRLQTLKRRRDAARVSNVQMFVTIKHLKHTKLFSYKKRSQSLKCLNTQKKLSERRLMRTFQSTTNQ